MTISVDQMYEKCREGVGFAAKNNPEHEYDDLPEDWTACSPTLKAFVGTATNFANMHAGEQYRQGYAGMRREAIARLDAARRVMQKEADDADKK